MASSRRLRAPSPCISNSKRRSELRRSATYGSAFAVTRRQSNKPRVAPSAARHQLQHCCALRRPGTLFGYQDARSRCNFDDPTGAGLPLVRASCSAFCFPAVGLALPSPSHPLLAAQRQTRRSSLGGPAATEAPYRTRPVSGHRFTPGRGPRRCGLVRLHLGSGDVIRRRPSSAIGALRRTGDW